MPSFLSLLCLLAAAAWLYLAFARGAFWRPLLSAAAPAPARWPSLDVIVPARNEAESLPESLPALLTQDYPGAWHVFLIDDHSDDGTAEIAAGIAADLDARERLTILTAPPLPPGWSGKVAAMNAGVGASGAEAVLFTDADILHAPDSLRKLAARMEEGRLALVSRMVRLNCESFAEKLLIPAFVFFFAMLYPFRLANNPRQKLAAAAGGTILVKREWLDAIGGLGRIKNALIDDCTLAKAVKDVGGGIELTLTEDISSLRPYPRIADVWRMVARTAYTQLRLSPWLLLGTLVGMAILYIAPLYAFLAAPSPEIALLGLLTWLGSAALYLPMVKFYRLPPVWALTLPAAALIYGAATFDSARLYHLGKGGQWKGRAQA